MKLLPLISKLDVFKIKYQLVLVAASIYFFFLSTKSKFLSLHQLTTNVKKNHLLLVADSASRPVAWPLADCTCCSTLLPDMGLGAVPAIQPARSKFCGVAEPPAAARLADESGPERDCFSNSSRISGSTGRN
jgi:hypothetical protein